MKFPPIQLIEYPDDSLHLRFPRPAFPILLKILESFIPENERSKANLDETMAVVQMKIATGNIGNDTIN